MRVLSLCVLVGVSLGLSPSSAMAQNVSWMLLGQIDWVSSSTPDRGLHAAFPTGATANIHFSYDPRTREASWTRWASDPDVGFYSLTYGIFDKQVDMEATMGKHAYWQPVTGGLQHVWVRRPASIKYDGDLTEQLGGDRIGSTVTWKPRSLNFSMGWPGLTLPTDALPAAIPAGTPGRGRFLLNLQTCRDTLSDPCPSGVRHTAMVSGTFHEVRPVITRGMDLIPGDSANVIDAAASRVPFAILGSAHFLPEIEVERSTIRVSRASVVDCAPGDVNGDGHTDLSCHISVGFRPRPGDPVVRLVARTRDGNYVRAVDTFTLR